jgi:hypothetical protein
MIDYTKLSQRLRPSKDGADHISLRTVTVSAVNANGTVDITGASGVVVPNVPKLATAFAPLGAVVQVMSLLGSFLVIGAVGSGGANGPMTKTGNFTGGPTGASFFTSIVAFGVTFPAVPNVHVNLNTATANAVQWVGRAHTISTTGFTMTAYGPLNTFSNQWQWTAIYAP